MIISGQEKDLSAAVHLAADGSQVDSGTIYCVARLESGDADDTKYWDSDDDTWQASPVAWPTAVHTQAGVWVFPLPAAASPSPKIGGSVSYTFTDNLTEGSATTVCGGGEHRIYAEDPLVTADLTTIESNIRGADSDDLKAISDQIDNVSSVSEAADAIWDEALSGHTGAGSAGEAQNRLDQDLSATESNIRGADSDDLKTLSDQLDNVVVPTGARQVIIHVKDGGAAPVPSVEVSVYDASNTSFLTRGNTDTDGDFPVALDDATYQLRMVKDLYGFTVPEPMIVTADATHNFTATAFTAPTPSSADLCVIYGFVKDAAGVAVAGACVEAYASIPQIVGGTQAGKRIANTSTNAEGYFKLELTKLAEVYFKIEDTGLDVVRTVPNAASQDVATWTA